MYLCRDVFTNHAAGMRFPLQYCSKFCFNSDNTTVLASSGLVLDVSVVAPRHVTQDVRAICQSPDVPATSQCSSVVQQVHPSLPDNTHQVYMLSN